eukprot:10579738-Ditylum_brightwellii.AAC.2
MVTTARTMKQHETHQELRGNISIQGSWQWQMEAIIDVRVTNSDAKSYLSTSVKSCLDDQEKEKRDKNLK